MSILCCNGKKIVHMAKRMICSLLQICKTFLAGVCFCFQSLELCIKRQPENHEKLQNWKENQLAGYSIAFSLIQMPQKLLWVLLIIKFVFIISIWVYRCHIQWVEYLNSGMRHTDHFPPGMEYLMVLVAILSLEHFLVLGHPSHSLVVPCWRK